MDLLRHVRLEQKNVYLGQILIMFVYFIRTQNVSQKSQKKRKLHFYKIKQISANCVNLWNICQFVQIHKPGAGPHMRRLTWNGHLLKAAVKALRYVFGNLKPRKIHWNPHAALKLLLRSANCSPL